VSEPDAGGAPLLVVVMGVAGCGKSTVGRALAEVLRSRFIEGDDFHAPASRAKMASGVPLSDEDRGPWLDALAAELAARARAGESAVVACSALKRAYRDRLRGGCAAFRLVFLDPEEGLIGERLSCRSGHYMPAALLASQLEILERPDADERAVVVNAAAEPMTVAREVADRLCAQVVAPP